MPTHLINMDKTMSQSNKDFFEQLEKHPELLERMKRLLKIVDAEGEGEIRNANLAEYAVIAELRPLGKELLEEWGKKQSSLANKNTKSSLPEVMPHSKKK